MSRPLVPELHDALKLTVYGHYDILLKPDKREVLDRLGPHFPNTNSWRGIIEHHCHVDAGLWPRSEDTFRLMVADGLAAGYSRPVAAGSRSFVVHKLWNPTRDPQDMRLNSDTDIAALLDFLCRDPSAEEFLTKYGDIMAGRGEESSAAQNLCSLGVHSRLVGRFYRLLAGAPGEYAVAASLLAQPESEDNYRQRVRQVKSQWRVKVVRVRVGFPQRPIRTRDLGILSVIEDKLDAFERARPDNVFYRAGRELLLYYASGADPSNDLRELCRLGCWVSVESAMPDLNVATDTNWLRRHLRSGPPVRAAELPDSFTPPICQLCQMAPASKRWPSDYTTPSADVAAEDAVSEDLCEDCFSLRREARPLTKLERWGAETGAQVAWVSLRLDFAGLAGALSELYRRYLASLGSTADDNPSVTMPVVSEFMTDYIRLRESIGSRLDRDFGSMNTETVGRDLWCLRCDSGRDVFRILAVMQDALRQFAPELTKLDRSPLALTVVLARAKFPFFEVLNALESAKDEVSVILPGKGSFWVPVKDVGRLAGAARGNYRLARGALEKLARVASISEELARLTANASSGPERETYEQFRPFGIGFKGLLTIARLLED